MSVGVPSKRVLLSSAAKRLTGDPSFMGWIIATDRKGSFNLAEIASDFGTDEASVVALALCKRPRTSREHFAADIRGIAAYSGVPQEQIAAMVRRVDALAALRSSNATELMAAAQDVIDPSSDSRPSEP